MDMKQKPLHFLLVMVLLCAQHAVWGAATYSGTNGVRAKVLLTNSVSACTGCHYNGSLGDGLGPDFTSSYSAFETYADDYHSGSNTSAVQAMIDRTSLPTNDVSFMPQGAGSQISSSEMSLLTAWKNNGAVNTDYPTTTTWSSATSSSKDFKLTSNSAKFTIWALVDDSGIDNTNYRFEYGLSQTAENVSSAQYLSGSGGGTSTTAISLQLSSMECGTTYYFRVRAWNSTYSYRYGSWQNHTTVACNTAPVISNTPLSPSNGTEDIAWQFDVNATDGEDDTITYSLSNEPSGMTINSSTGLISWTPVEGQTASGTVTVTAADDGADGVTADTATFSISVAAVNDVPQITSSPSTSAVEGVQYTYQVTVNDPDDSGLDLTYSLSNQPAGMAVSTSGLVTWTPGNGVSTSGNVTLTVEDDDGASDSENFTISVNGVNSPPTITSTAPTTASEDTLYQYQLVVSDADDANNGVDLSYALSGEPDGMEVSNTGLITWMPPADVFAANDITVRVADGGENSASPDYETFSITVSAVNDAPVLSGIPNQAITELQTFTLDLAGYHSDEDDDNNGTDLDWRIVQGPTDMTLSSLGKLNWQSEENSAGVYTIEIQLSDGGEDSVTAAIDSFTLTVNLLDDDNDGVANYNDNCLSVSNGDQANFDDDTLGDACDTDDDNDGISDAVEAANNLNPYDASDALLDADGDGLSNLDEFNTCLAAADSVCTAIGIDSVAPVIETNGDITVDATGYLTHVEISAVAIDESDGVVEVTSDISSPFRPGRHVITWTAVDSSDNSAQVQQTVNVRPELRFGGSVIRGENQAVTIPVQLSGDAPQYPVEFSFSLLGSADSSDHSLQAGTLSLASGSKTEIEFNVIEDDISEGDETLSIQLSVSGSNADWIKASDEKTFDVYIVDRNVKPSISLELWQNGQAVSTAYQDQGDFTVRAEVEDANNDALTVSWTTKQSKSLDSQSLNQSGASVTVTTTAQSSQHDFTFDPSTLTVGFYEIALTVSDGEVSTEQSLEFLLADVAPVLDATDSDGDGIADNAEGLGDSDGDGIVDYLDPVLDQQFMHKNLNGSESDYLRTQSGHTLKVGQWARKAESGGAQISSVDLPDFTPANNVLSGELVDFEIHGTNEINPYARLVIPLTTPIPVDAEYWKFDGESWKAFDDSGQDYVASSAKVDEACPDADSDQFIPGLKPFDECLLLVIEDGGPNDTDGDVNGVVRDPGGFTIPSVSDVQQQQSNLQKPSSSPGGAGSLYYLLVMLILILTVRPVIADDHMRLFTGTDGTLAYDSNLTQAEDDVNIIADRFARVDGRAAIKYALAFNHSVIAEGFAAYQGYEFTPSLNRSEYGARFMYRWQNSFSFRSPWYQIMLEGQSWDVQVDQRDSDFLLAQVMASARFTTRISWVFGLEHKQRDSDGLVFDLEQNRAFFHMDYRRRFGTFYGGLSYLDGETVSTIQNQYCNGLVETNVYYVLKVSNEIEWDQAFSDDYCGNWISYQLDATTYTGTFGFNHALSHSLAIDASILYADVSAEGGNTYQRQMIQFALLKAF